MVELLRAADFAGSPRGLFRPDGRLYAQPCDLSLKQYRNSRIPLGNRMGLSTGAHTLAIYRRLPEGWRPAPPDVFTDQYMWRQILAMPGCRAVSGYRPTGIGFSSLERRHMSLEEREREMERWAAAIVDPAALRGLREEILVASLKLAMWDAHFYAERRGWRGVWRAIRSQPTLRRLARRLRGKPAETPTG
jgi:hypothetical protein